MKKLIIAQIILLILLPQIVFSQDKIVFKNGNKLEVTVTKVGLNIVEYKRFDNVSGPIYEVLKEDISSITYQNGVVDSFSVTETSQHIEAPSTQKKGTFIDERDGVSYEYVQIGTQIWMTENLKYDVGQNHSPCDPNNCEDCGRYYYYEDALSACPEGWHLPTDKEWMELEVEVGMNQAEAAKTGWRGTSPGQAPYLLLKGKSGLDLRMCGLGRKSNLSNKNHKYYFSYSFEHAYYWTATEDRTSFDDVYIRHLKDRASIERVATYASSLLPVRCVKNN